MADATAQIDGKDGRDAYYNSGTKGQPGDAVPIGGDSHSHHPRGGPDEPYLSYHDLFLERWHIGNPITILFHEWRKLVAEIIGTAILVYFGTASAIAALTITGMDTGAILVIAFGFGFGGAVAIYGAAETSGGHVNPAVSFAMFVAAKMTFFQCLFYIGAQLVGAILASALVKGCFPDNVADSINYGATGLASRQAWGTTNTPSGELDISVGQGVLFEAVFTFCLVFTVFATVKIPREVTHQGRLAPLAVGLSILIGHLVGARFTGPAMNPARAFGPAVISGMNFFLLPAATFAPFSVSVSY
eukprot:TRINITY_DN4652_c0_g1_i2.p1 TRINITY_DN4652_c0_g1~~TRINITY_DN4652_c0_g1_i2.p1  ORF type:complete len:302 (-),score=42.68 TRINITY_DN4652_c0_g1_i2:238-1143(-)